MNIQSISMAVFIAFGFVCWPIVGSYSRVCGSWVSATVIISTAVTVAIFFFRQLAALPVPSVKAIAILFIAGAINGLAFCFYSNKITDTSIETGAFVVTISILMVVIAPLLDWALNGATPNMSQKLGFVLAIVAIYFMSK